MRKFQIIQVSEMKKIIGIVPARLAATRFPNKPLKDICESLCYSTCLKDQTL